LFVAHAFLSVSEGEALKNQHILLNNTNINKEITILWPSTAYFFFSFSVSLYWLVVVVVLVIVVVVAVVVVVARKEQFWNK
jgi:hypothetical protein